MTTVGAHRARPAAQGKEWLGGVVDVRDWLAESATTTEVVATQVDLDDIAPWSSDPVTGDLVHPSGHFFRVTGVRVDLPEDPVRSWSQPIIDQPEIGILGFLAARVDGRLHVLVQAKAEPGNCNGIQLSPTVQATWSNHTGVHGGSSVPYVAYFATDHEGRALIDVLQSEQAAWFYQKRNRNMLVMLEDAADIEVLPGFAWLALEDLYRCLLDADVVNMDARTVLSCLPLHAIGGWVDPVPGTDDRVAAGVRRSLHPDTVPRVPFERLLSWITRHRSMPGLRGTMVALNSVEDGWLRTAASIRHVEGRHFEIVGVRVKARGREVGEWCQPMLAPCSEGLAAYLAAEFDGVLHLLVRIAPSPGYREGVELGPTVQCVPTETTQAERYLDRVVGAAPEHELFVSVLSEEGGRFLRARTEYRIVDVSDDPPLDLPPDYQWVTLHQLGTLLQHSHYVNVEGRTLIAAAHGLAVAREDRRP